MRNRVVKEFYPPIHTTSPKHTPKSLNTLIVTGLSINKTLLIVIEETLQGCYMNIFCPTVPSNYSGSSSDADHIQYNTELLRWGCCWKDTHQTTLHACCIHQSNHGCRNQRVSAYHSRLYATHDLDPPFYIVSFVIDVLTWHQLLQGPKSSKVPSQFLCQQPHHGHVVIV